MLDAVVDAAVTVAASVDEPSQPQQLATDAAAEATTEGDATATAAETTVQPVDVALALALTQDAPEFAESAPETPADGTAVVAAADELAGTKKETPAKGKGRRRRH